MAEAGRFLRIFYVSTDLDATSNNLDTKPILSVKDSVLTVGQHLLLLYTFLPNTPPTYPNAIMSRPELTGHASLFYNAKEARKYDSSSRMVGIQREITERAIELLKLPSPGPREGGRPSFILDVGCGSGLSGQVRSLSSLLFFESLCRCINGCEEGCSFCLL